MWAKINKNIAKRLYLNFFIVILIFACPSQGLSQEKDLSKIKAVQDDIKIINLLNNLDLREGQIRYIIQQAELTKSMRERTLYKIGLLSSDMAEASEEIKEKVGTGRVVIDKGAVMKFRETKAEIERFKKDEYATLGQAALAVEKALEPFQIIALDDYNPCIIPIISNGRIGQSDSASGIAKTLERIKDIPAVRYNRRKELFVYKLLERMKNRLPPQVEFSESKTRTMIMDIFEMVRAMDDADFQIKKNDIAEELKNSILPEKREIPRKTKIKKFLLSKNTIPILKDRLNN